MWRAGSARVRLACSILSLPVLAVFGAGCAAQAPFRDAVVETPAGPIHYQGRGHGPAIVFIHGGMMDCRMWDEQFLNWPAERARLIRYDVRGNGQSPPASQPYSFQDDLRDLLDRLHIEKATLVGLSLGGRIAIDFAIAHPERVDKLVAVAPGLSGYHWGIKTVMDGRLHDEAFQAGEFEWAADLWLDDPMMVGVKENPALRARVRRLVIENSKPAGGDALLFRGLRPPAAGRLAEIKAPTLALVGDRDNPDIKKIVDMIARDVSGARKVVIPGASHILNMEKPREFDAAARAFLGL